MAMTVEEAHKELSEVEAKLQDLEKLAQRRDLLRQFVRLGEQLSSSNSATATSPAAFLGGAPRSSRDEGGDSTGKKLRTWEIAYRILSARGKLHMDDLLKKAHESGWTGSGDDETDKNRLYAAMYRLPKKFKGHGAGYWSAKEEQNPKGMV